MTPEQEEKRDADMKKYMAERDEQRRRKKEAEEARRRASQDRMAAEWALHTPQTDPDIEPKKSRRKLIWQVRAERFRSGDR